VTAVVCLYLGGLLATNLGGLPGGSALGAIFPHLGGTFDASSLEAEWADIENNYVLRGVPPSLAGQATEQALVQALDQQYGDRFTALLTKSEYQQFDQSLNQQRAGSIGITLEERCAGAEICPSGQSPTVLAIEQVLHGQPAERAGLRNGDILEAVGSKPVGSLGATLSAQLAGVSPLIRGAAGTTVSLTVLRGTRSLTLTATRANLSLPTVYSRMFGQVLDLQVVSFGTGTGQDAVGQLERGIAAGARAVVLDLRGDGGGYVSEAVTLASQFLTPHGSEQDVVIRRGRMDLQARPSTAQTVIKDPIAAGGVAPTLPLVVLVDGATASAAEIVTAALRDYHRATIVGARTYGKGSVQVDYTLPNGDDLHLTVERWYGPSGESIDGTGITPGVPVSLPSPDDLYTLEAQSAAPSQDPQLQAALAIAQGQAG
jgi:carboxyl-terminal processing protease